MAAAADSETITLNVGGTEFTTTLDTLTSDPNSMLAAMFSGRHAVDEVPFIDRDPKHFGAVLNSLRDGGRTVVPLDPQEREELVREAEFYQATGLLSLLQGRQGRDLALGAANVRLREEEDAVRALFLPSAGAGPGDWVCGDCDFHNQAADECDMCGKGAPAPADAGARPPVPPDAGMDYVLDVFDARVLGSFVFEDPSSPQMPVLMCPPPEPRADGARVCESLGEYQAQFTALTRGVLAGLDWSNVLCAGGLALAALLPVADEARGLSAPELADYMNLVQDDYWEAEDATQLPHRGFRGSDVDLFLYGMDEQAALRKVQDIHDIVARNAAHRNVTVVRTRRTVTIAPGWPLRNVQVILRLYANPAEVLLGFDLDAVGVGFDGRRVWALPRARRAINARCNIADPSRQTYRTLSYEYRLWKYAQRGFGVVVPCFDRQRVDSSLFVRGWSDLRGLARLLYLEARMRQLETMPAKGRYVGGLGYTHIKHDMPDNLNGSLADADAEENISSYNDGVLVPFGPGLHWFSIRHKLRQKAALARATGVPVGFVYGTFAQAMNHAEPPSSVKVPQAPHFVGSLGEYVRTLPTVEDDWFQGAYL